MDKDKRGRALSIHRLFYGKPGNCQKSSGTVQSPLDLANLSFFPGVIDDAPDLPFGEPGLILQRL